ncbi:kinesin-like protein Klp8 [Dinochytrium kinnereticum]|nr:kinesin-like protein Klp8 [Dinochytrium kinnereticum]
MMGYEGERGIIPRACEELFARIGQETDPNVRFEVNVSYIEIYNEKVRDLLNPNNAGNLRVREHPTLGPYVEDLSKLVVRSYDDVENLMEAGNKARTVASTNMNETSSRSHAVFTVILTQTRSTPSRAERVSRISLVDLAGSERADATGARGQRLKEGANINKSLTALGKVISGLADLSSGLMTSGGAEGESGGVGSGAEGVVGRKLAARRSRVLEPFIPYRDSVLTWLLKDCLGGNSKTIMLAAVSPTDTSHDETLSTLRYAERAKRIVNRAVVNEDQGPNGVVVRELRSEIDRLKERLATFESIDVGDRVTPVGVAVTAVESVTAAEFTNLREQLEASEKLVAELTQSYEERLRRTLEIRELPNGPPLIAASRPTSSLSLNPPSLTGAALGVVVRPPRSVPHLVNLGEDPGMVEGILYRIPAPGLYRVGTDALICAILILATAALIKEANVIAKELRKDVHFDLIIVPPDEDLNPLSFWETGSETVLDDLSSPISSPSSPPSPETAPLQSTLYSTLKSRRPTLAVRVLNGRDNAIFNIPLNTLKRRLPAMKAEYEITDLASAFYAETRRVDASLSVFYSPDPLFPFPNGGSEVRPRVVAPWFDRIGVANVGVANLGGSEARVPVFGGECGEKIVGVLGVVVTLISSHPPLSSPGNEGALVDGGVVMLEVAILEVSGIRETEFTQVHCQFRLGSFGVDVGDGKSRRRGQMGVFKEGRRVLADKFGVDDEEDDDAYMTMSRRPTNDRVFCTDPVSDFGDRPIRWGFSQTVVVPVDEGVRRVFAAGTVGFEVFGRRVRPVVAIIDGVYRLGTGKSATAPPLADTTDASAAPLPDIPLPPTMPGPNPGKEIARPTSPVVAKPGGLLEGTHFVLAQLQILELSHHTGEFKSVPVQSGSGSGQASQGWKALIAPSHGHGMASSDVEEPNDVFMLRQGLQRRLSIRLSHASGAALPWRRIAYIRVGRTRRFDMRTGLAMEDEGVGVVDLGLPSPSPLAAVEPDGRCWVGTEASWDSSLHGCPHLNRPSKHWRVRMVVEVGVEVADIPITNLADRLRASSTGKTPAPRIMTFSVPFEVLMHDREAKVRTSTLVLEFFANAGLLPNPSRFLTRARAVFSVTVKPASAEKDIAAITGRTRSGSFSFSSRREADDEIRGGGLSKSFDGRHVLARHRSASVLPRSEDLSFSGALPAESRVDYVRGEENLGMWKPSGVELLIKYLRARKRVRIAAEIEGVRGRIGMIGFTEVSEGDIEGAGYKKDSLVLLRKCVELWRWNHPGKNLSLKRMLEMGTMDLPRRDERPSIVGRAAEVEMACAISRVRLSSPVSFKGYLSTPGEGEGTWIRRYFVLRRPCLYMHASASEMDEVAVFGLPNTSVQYGPELGALYYQKELVFALLGPHSTLILQAEKKGEMDSWISVLDPLHVGAMLSRLGNAQGAWP